MGDLEIKRESYENGLVLIGNPVKETETVAIAGSIKSGAMWDELGKFGAAELVSRLLLRGTKGHTAGQLSQLLEETGSTLEFTNRDESVTFSGRCYYGALKQLLGTVREALIEPVFPEEEIEGARAEILYEIKSEEDETRSMAYKEVMGLIYGKDMPYGRDSLGKSEELERLTRSDLKRFYDENYHPSRVVLAMTGKLDFEELRDEIGKLFSSWSGSQGINFTREKVNRNASMASVEMSHKSQVDLVFGARAVDRNSPHFYSLNLGNLVLGRMGLYGRLGENVREEKGLAYYSYSVVQARLYDGNLSIFAGVNPRNVEKAIEGITEEISRISTESLSEDELAGARKNATGSLSISLDTSIERVNIIHDMEYYNLGIDYLDRYPEILSKITPEQVLSDFAKYFSVDRISMAAAGPLGDGKFKLPKDTMKIMGRSSKRQIN